MRHRHHGFILLFGTRAVVSNDAGPSATAQCPQCGQLTTFVPKGVRYWFTLFFIPLFPISGKRPLAECTNCGAQLQGSTQDLGAHVQRMDARDNQRAIALYNSLRASPGNAITLNELMQTYAQMGEFDQAISAASQFPDALNASEQCMATLGRVYLAKNDFAGALRWLDAAVARNPVYGEAQYYKAVAHLTSPTPDYAQAITAARAARSAGYPRADELLREAEQRR
jgi:tetratricopeptide (TPR) repeat protein